MNKNDPTNFYVDFENFSDKDLYAYCKKVGFNARIWSRKFMATIPEVAKRKLYKKYGYCSIHEFASKMAGMSHENVDGVLRVDEKFKEMPKMKALIGEVGLSKLKVVACIATKETDGFWAEKVTNMTKSSLEIYVKEIKRKEGIQNVLQKFPGELSAEKLETQQQQRQISIFDSEKPMSQNSNDARVERNQNHDKKTFTIQIDTETEFELRKFKQQLEKERKEPVDWNSALKEMIKMIKRVSNEKSVTFGNIKTVNAEKDPFSEPRTHQPAAFSRYIPAKIKQGIKNKYHGHCAYKNCNKPAEQIHHPESFAIKHNHENLIPLCKNHHDFVHQSAAKSVCNEINHIFNIYKTEKYSTLG